MTKILKITWTAEVDNPETATQIITQLANLDVPGARTNFARDDDDREPKSLKAIKKELGLTNLDIAEMFGYASYQSYYGSSGRQKIEDGIVKLYELIKSKEQ